MASGYAMFVLVFMLSIADVDGPRILGSALTVGYILHDVV